MKFQSFLASLKFKFSNFFSVTHVNQEFVFTDGFFLACNVGTEPYYSNNTEALLYTEVVKNSTEISLPETTTHPASNREITEKTISNGSQKWPIIYQILFVIIVFRVIYSHIIC